MASNNLSRVVWDMSLPIIFVEATETFDHVIDTLFLARVGITELGTIAVADSVMLLFLILPLAMVDGLQIVTARRVGQRRPEAVGAAFNQGLALVLVLGVLGTVALKLFSPLVAYSVVASTSVGAALDSYLQLDAYSLPLAGLTFACSALLTSMGKTRVLIPAAIIVVVTDLVLNYLFIFGKFGFPELGIRGAAIGSIGAELAAGVFLLLHIWRRFNPGTYGFLRFWRYEGRTTRLLSLLSGPIAAQRVLEHVRWLVFFLIIERVGTVPLAIANIVYTCFIVFWIPTEGFAETTCSLVSRYVGRNRAYRIGALMRSAVRGAIIATIPFILLALLAPQWLVAAFSSEPDLLGQSNASLRVVAIAMLIAIPGELWLTAVIATGDTLGSFGIQAVLSVVMIGFTYLAAIHMAWPIERVWLTVPLTWLLGLAISYAWIRTGLWKRFTVH